MLLRRVTLYDLQSTSLLRKMPSREPRAALGELLPPDKLDAPFYERSLRTLTAPDFSPGAVTYGRRDEPGKRGDGTLLVASVDLDRAKSDPLFGRRVLQGHSVYMSRIGINEFSRRVDCDILDRLAAEGYEPSGHWLVDNLQRIVPEADGKTLPEPCGGTGDFVAA